MKDLNLKIEIGKYRGSQNEFYKIEIYESQNLEDQKSEGEIYRIAFKENILKRKIYLNRICNQGT